MSFILDALQKARRETPPAEEGGHVPRALQPQPIHVRARPVRLMPIVVLVVCCTVLCLAGVAFALWFVVSRTQSAYPPAALVIPAPATAAVPSAVSAAPSPVADLPVTRPVPAAAPEASPVVPDLPPPVPVNQLTAAPSPSPSPASYVTASPSSGSGEPPRSTEGFSLGAILYDTNMRIAVINGEMVYEGEDRGDYKVLEITPRSVTVQRPGQKPVVLGMKSQ
jgi:hypothetical protein